MPPGHRATLPQRIDYNHSSPRAGLNGGGGVGAPLAVGSHSWALRFLEEAEPKAG